MLDLATERDIVEGEARVERKIAVAERLGAGMQDLAVAETLLVKTRKMLERWKNRRDAVPTTIAGLKDGERDAGEDRP